MAQQHRSAAAPCGHGTHGGCSFGSCSEDRGQMSALLRANREWAAEMRAADPEFFSRLQAQQTPEYLWIGCSDSRVPANQILGLAPGEIFVQRNVGNQAMHTDMNLMSCLEYAVKSIKVKTIILCGHYGCGAVKAALQLPHTTPGLVNCWISDIRECRNRAEAELRNLDAEQQLARLCELNVLRQLFHVATSPVVASAWAEGQELHLYGVIYDLADGHLRKLAGPISGDDGYAHSLEGFVADGLRVERCPETQLLRVSAAEDGGDECCAARAGSGHSRGGCGSARCSDLGGRCESGDRVLPLPMLSSPSEIMSSINNINLQESIAKHKNWGSSDNMRAGLRSSSGSSGSSAGGSTPAALSPGVSPTGGGAPAPAPAPLALAGAAATPCC